MRQFSAIPAWLAVALDLDQVMMALNRHVPEFASGAVALRNCKIDLLHLKDTKDEWGRNWTLTVADADGERRIPVRVALIPPGVHADDQPAAPLPLDSSDWHCWLPEVRLLFKSFLAAYEAHAPVSRQRVALWEAIFYLNDSLQCRTKPWPNDARLVVPLLERQFHRLSTPNRKNIPTFDDRR